MVALGAFPAAKLGALLLRQVSKPIANFVKERAKQSPVFRSYVCMPPAQFYNWCEVKMKMYFMNLGTAGKVKPLSETMAIELGSNLLGEGIIFVVAAALLLLEYNRQVRKEQAKEEVRLQEQEDLISTIRDLDLMTEQHTAELRRLTYLVDDLISKVNSKSYPGPDISETPTSSNKVDTKRQEPELNKQISNDINENVLFKSIKMLIQSLQQV
ncbi:optic atrophy 3 protein homolog [Acyrthosiphon pisum]|uniref:ACYPI004391 protein n=1 Tax=Acyrthosiphon pisum TaxID=7029 RepID=C4WWR3_ACYPI|nr:optic atrophy 3 protein homolog [Acyrthosiphon pisum]BAH72333.1 ACYPI004391 [Acyrthosiphon pisum]|eukprot:NP_001156162.1 optic atrophy 3 protein homolog [Acyrthosiphon pisum]